MATELSSAQLEILEVIKNNVDERLASRLSYSTGFLDGDIDSIQYITVAVKLEEVFHIEFDDDKIFGSFDTILSMIEYVEYKMKLTKIEHKIFETLKLHLDGTSKDIDFRSDFIDAGMNSVNFVDVVVKLEEIFQIEFDDEKLVFGVLHNTNSLAEYVNSLLDKDKPLPFLLKN